MKAYVTYSFAVNFHPVETFDPLVKIVRVGNHNYTPVVIGSAKAGDGSTYQVSAPLLSLELSGEEGFEAFKTAFSERVGKMLDDFRSKWVEISSTPSEPPKVLEVKNQKPAAKAKVVKKAKK